MTHRFLTVESREAPKGVHRSERRENQTWKQSEAINGRNIEFEAVEFSKPLACQYRRRFKPIQLETVRERRWIGKALDSELFDR